jgi:predicted component of type VI protein secretion system
MAAYLEILSGRSAGRRYPLGAQEVVLGRDESCEISLLDEAISRRHAAVARRGERWVLRDLGSRNGTALNGFPLPAGREEALRTGDEIAIGGARLRFVDEAERTRETASLAPAPAGEDFRVERAVRIEGGLEPGARRDPPPRGRPRARSLAITPLPGPLHRRAPGEGLPLLRGGHGGPP